MQENNKLAEQISRCITDIMLNHSLPKTGEQLRGFSRVFNSVSADKEILKKLNQHNSLNRGFINTILGLFGLTIISERDKEDISIDKDFFKQFIEIDKEKATTELKVLIEAFQSMEDALQAHENKLTMQLQEQLSAVEALKKENSQLQYQYKTDQEEYYMSMQRILSEIGPAPQQEGEVKLKKIIDETLEQFSIMAIWDIPEGDNGKMFTIQKTGIKRNRIVQNPCLIKQDEVILKGLAYQQVEGE